jgi:prophage antirepressor-like protein
MEITIKNPNATSVQVFQNTRFGEIRVAKDRNGEPLFCLADLCKALNLTNPSDVAKKLDAEDKPKLNLGLSGQLPTFVTEPGMYTVILRSDSPLAKPMQKWVTSEVLPAIRRTGGYMAAKQDETPEEKNSKMLGGSKNCRTFAIAKTVVKFTPQEHRLLLKIFWAFFMPA